MAMERNPTASSGIQWNKSNSMAATNAGRNSKTQLIGTGNAEATWLIRRNSKSGRWCADGNPSGPPLNSGRHNSGKIRTFSTRLPLVGSCGHQPRPFSAQSNRKRWIQVSFRIYWLGYWHSPSSLSTPPISTTSSTTSPSKVSSDSVPFTTMFGRFTPQISKYRRRGCRQPLSDEDHLPFEQHLAVVHSNYLWLCNFNEDFVTNLWRLFSPIFGDLNPPLVFCSWYRFINFFFFKISINNSVWALKYRLSELLIAIR